MPLVRITLLKGRSKAGLQAIADGVHAALVETYSVPLDDRFQIIEQCEPGEIVYSPTYMGIERTDDIVIVHIVAGHWRDTAAKQALYRTMVDKLAANPGLRREDVQIIITSNDKPDWSFDSGVASYVAEAS